MISEKARYLRSAEIQYTPSKIWPGEYNSGLDKYEQTFFGFGPNPIKNLLKERKVRKLKTTMFDMAASGALIEELRKLRLIDFGISFTLVDPRHGPFVKMSDLLNGSLLKIGDIVDTRTFAQLPTKAQVITFRPVGAFDDYPESEFIKALSNGIDCLDNGGVLFAQFPASTHSFDNNKGHRIMNDLNLGDKWNVEIIENGYRRSVQRGYHFESMTMVTHPIVKIERNYISDSYL